MINIVETPKTTARWTVADEIQQAIRLTERNACEQFSIDHHFDVQPNRFAIIAPCPKNTHLMGRKSKKPTHIRKPLSYATYRIAELAVPKRTHVLATWRKYYDVLPAEHIINFESIVNGKLAVSIADAAAYNRQQRINESRIRSKRRRHIQRIKRKMLRHMMKSVYDFAKEYLLSREQLPTLNSEMATMSDVIREMLSNFADDELPKRTSDSDFFDQFIIELADKITHWINDLMSKAKYEHFATPPDYSQPPAGNTEYVDNVDEYEENEEDFEYEENEEDYENDVELETGNIETYAASTTNPVK